MVPEPPFKAPRRASDLCLRISLAERELRKKVSPRLRMNLWRIGQHGLLWINRRGQWVEIKFDQVDGVLSNVAVDGHDDGNRLPDVTNRADRK